jgi:CheY-like chemotaxis protein
VHTSVSRVFAIAVREVVPTLMRRHQSYTYTEHHCAWTIDSRDRLVETSVHRLGLCASDMLHHGFVAFDARGRPLRSGGCALTVRIAGAGPLRHANDVEHALTALGLEIGPREGGHDGNTQLKRAHGQCPATQARVDFSGLPLAGFIFSAVYTLRDALPPHDEQDSRHGPSAPSGKSSPRLWLLQSDTLSAASVIAQGQSHGWAVSSFTSALQVRQRLRSLGPSQAAPALFVCFVNDAASAEEALALSTQLPQATHRIGAVVLGAEWLSRPELAESYELACHPFCHDDWARWTATFSVSADEASGTTHPAPLASDDRVSVLVVDDDEFARELTRFMVDALGYDCLVVGSGHEAVECCRTEGPSLVLMDLEMPGMDGYETTRLLRSLQQAGRVAPCRIVAHSSLSDAEAVRAALLAGVDAFLAKPVPIDTLRAELRRWSAARTVHTGHGNHCNSTTSSSEPVRCITSTPTLLR